MLTCSPDPTSSWMLCTEGTPVRSLFRVVQCFRLSSTPLTYSAGSGTWRCTRVGPDPSHSCFHVAAIYSFFDRSSGMTLSLLVVGFTGLESAWRHFIVCRAGCASRVSLISLPRRGWLLSALGQPGLSLLRQGAETHVSA